jgi:hypothetical protein
MASEAAEEAAKLKDAPMPERAFVWQGCPANRSRARKRARRKMQAASRRANRP